MIYRCLYDDGDFIKDHIYYVIDGQVRISNTHIVFNNPPSMIQMPTGHTIYAKMYKPESSLHKRIFKITLKDKAFQGEYYTNRYKLVDERYAI